MLTSPTSRDSFVIQSPGHNSNQPPLGSDDTFGFFTEKLTEENGQGMIVTSHSEQATRQDSNVAQVKSTRCAKNEKKVQESSQKAKATKQIKKVVVKASIKPTAVAANQTRVQEVDKDYFESSQKKIDEIKSRLKTAKKDGIPVPERQRLRNQVSALQNRIKKRKEVLHLKQIIKQKDARLEIFLEILNKQVRETPDCQQFMDGLHGKMS